MADKQSSLLNEMDHLLASGWREHTFSHIDVQHVN